MLKEIIKPESVKVNLESEDKEEVIAEMTEILIALAPELDRDEVVKSLLLREAKMTTGIITGIAIPHSISDKVKKPVCAVGISKKGIDYGSLDGKPVHAVFMFVFPSGDTATHLNIMQRMAYVFGVADFYKNLMEQDTPNKIIQTIISAEARL